MALRTSTEMSSFIESIKGVLDDIDAQYTKLRKKDLTMSKAAYICAVLISNTIEIIRDVLGNLAVSLKDRKVE